MLLCLYTLTILAYHLADLALMEIYRRKDLSHGQFQVATHIYGIVFIRPHTMPHVLDLIKNGKMILNVYMHRGRT